MNANIAIGAAILGLMGGVLSRSFPSAWPYFVAVSFGGALILFFYRAHRTIVVAALITMVAFMAGSWRMAEEQLTHEAAVELLLPYEAEEVVFEGTIIRDPEMRENAKVMVVLLQGSTELIRVSAERTLDVRYGDRVEVAGVLERPMAFETEFGRTFPYEAYLRAQGVTHTVSRASVEVLARGGGHAFLRLLFAVKHRFAASVASLLPEPHASLALGLLLGEKHGLGERLESVFRTVGIIHIIVLSGYNLTIVAEALMRVLTPVFLPRMRALVGVCAIVAFALAVGPSATVVRATLMALLVLFARVTGKTYDALRALLLAGTLMIFLNPYALAFDPGFQFSYLATLGLILVGPMVDRWIAFIPSYAGAREYASATIATQIAVAPLLLWSIGAVSLIAVIANVLILVAVPIAMLLVFVAGLVGLIVPALTVVAYPAYLALGYILGAAEVLVRVPYAEITVPPFPFSIAVFCYAVIGACIFFFMQSKTPDKALASSGVAARG